MPATAANLRDLHQLHQRAKAIRDRMTSGPKTLAARQLALATRRAAVEASRKALQDAKVQQSKREHAVQGHQSKMDDLRIKLNAVKKNEEYKAIQNQIALDKSHVEKIEGEILDDMVRIDALAAKLAAEEAEVKALTAEVEALTARIESEAAGQRAQLQELETAVIEAENVIPPDLRERFRRTVKQYGADAMSPVEVDYKTHLGACTGCFVTITTQTLNEIINAENLSFCKTCGRILYLAEEDIHNTRRSSR